MNKVVIKILQGSVVTQTTLGGPTTCTYPKVTNFLQCICAKENWMRVDQVIATKQWLFGPLRYNVIHMI